MFLTFLTALGLVMTVRAADPPGPGPFGNEVLAQPVSGAERAATEDGWKKGKLCEIGDEYNNTNATAALQEAINECGDRDEGGTVLVKEGLQLLSASLFLKSNLTFRVEKGAAITSTATGYGKKTNTDNTNVTDAPIVYTRRECLMMDAHAGMFNGGRCLKKKEKLNGYDDCEEWSTLENVVLEGGGLLDANGEAWYDKSDPDFVSQWRPMMLDLLWIRGLTIRDLDIRRPGFWTVHPTFSDNVVIANNSIVTSGSNTDGCDPDSSWNVLISGNTFDNGDDCIAIKSGRDMSGRMVNISTRNVLAEKNYYKRGHGVSIGSETSGWVYDVIIRDSIVNGTDKAVRIKSARGRGGGVKNTTYSNISGTVEYAVSLSLDYEGETPTTNNSATPEIHDIHVKDCHLTVTGKMKSSEFYAYLGHSEPNDLECLGLDDSPITGVTFDNVTVVAASGDLEMKCESCSGSADSMTDPPPCFVETTSFPHSSISSSSSSIN